MQSPHAGQESHAETDARPASDRAARLEQLLQPTGRPLPFPPTLERAFRLHFLEESLPNLRLGMVAGLVLFAGFGVWDLVSFPMEVLVPSLFLRLGLACPLMVAVLVAASRRWPPRALEGLRLAMVMGVGGAVVGITALANAAGLHAAPHGLFLVAVAAYTITGMRAQQAVAAGLLILALQAAADLLTQRDLAEIAEPILFILSANVIGAATAVSHERAARTSFLRMKLLECRADLDGLTGIPNRRAFDRAAERAFQAAAREKVGVVFALFDVDRFKAFNDHLGHVAGDACLQRIARAFEATAQRPLDFAARIGGEEFAVIWYDASPQGALVLAKRVQGAVEALDIAHPEPESEAQVTVSGGAVYLHPRSQETLAAMAEADDALYEAKRSGRARVVVRVLDTN